MCLSVTSSNCSTYCRRFEIILEPQTSATGQHLCSGVTTGWTGVDISTPLLLEVAPEIDTNPTSFYSGRGGGGSLRLQTPVIGSRSPCLSTPHILTWRRPAFTDCRSKFYRLNNISRSQKTYCSLYTEVSQFQRQCALNLFFVNSDNESYSNCRTHTPRPV